MKPKATAKTKARQMAPQAPVQETILDDIDQENPGAIREVMRCLAYVNHPERSPGSRAIADAPFSRKARKASVKCQNEMVAYPLAEPLVRLFMRSAAEGNDEDDGKVCYTAKWLIREASWACKFRPNTTAFRQAWRMQDEYFRIAHEMPYPELQWPDPEAAYQSSEEGGADTENGEDVCPLLLVEVMYLTDIGQEELGDDEFGSPPPSGRSVSRRVSTGTTMESGSDKVSSRGKIDPAEDKKRTRSK